MKSTDKERMMNNFLYVLIVFFIISCSDNDEATNDPSVIGNNESDETYFIEDLRWIEGVWLDSTTFSFRTPKVSFMEKWKCYPDSISGKGISIKENDTTITSALCIREVNGEIKYIARPAGEAMIPFSLTFMSDIEAVFENPVNDFPQKIRYLKTSKDSLQVIISGIRPEGERAVTFKMRSVSF
jgi:hypothetical protein